MVLLSLLLKEKRQQVIEVSIYFTSFFFSVLEALTDIYVYVYISC